MEKKIKEAIPVVSDKREIYEDWLWHHSHSAGSIRLSDKPQRYFHKRSYPTSGEDYR